MTKRISTIPGCLIANGLMIANVKRSVFMPTAEPLGSLGKQSTSALAAAISGQTTEMRHEFVGQFW